MGDINWLAVVLAAIAAFVVGGIWYGPLFGKAWMVAAGKTEEELKATNPGRVFGPAFVLALLSSFMLGHMFARFGQLPAHLYFMMSGGIALAFVVPAIWTNYLFLRARLKLALIDGGYWLAFYLTMGLVYFLLS